MKRSKTLSIAIPTPWSTGKINAAIDTLVKAIGPNSANMKLLAETALHALLHAHKTGDVTLCERLFVSLGGEKNNRSKAAIRVEAYKSWIRKCGPITADKESGHWKIKEGVSWQDESQWDLARAVSKPFWEEMGSEVRYMDFDNLMNLLKGLTKRIDKTDEKGNPLYKGDREAAKTWAANVISFAEQQAKHLSSSQKGIEDVTQEAVLSSVKSRETRRVKQASSSEAQPVAI